MLDYTESTLRTDTQLFNDARAFAVTGVQRWPSDFAVSVADLHLWTHTRARVPAQADSPAIGHLRNQIRPEPSADPSRTTAPEPAQGLTTRQPVRRPPLSQTLEA